jgi:hypothetical protein
MPVAGLPIGGPQARPGQGMHGGDVITGKEPSSYQTYSNNDWLV